MKEIVVVCASEEKSSRAQEEINKKIAAEVHVRRETHFLVESSTNLSTASVTGRHVITLSTTLTFRPRTALVERHKSEPAPAMPPAVPVS